MSGHSKWHSIKHKKAAEDKKRAKIFTKHAKLIAIAARKGSDPGMNPSLRAAMDNARAENMPFENIDRAIKKGSGEGKDAVQIDEVIYEGYGPGGVALLIETLTDNRNRTVSAIKLIMSKKGGNMGSSGAVAYLFNKKGIINVPTEGKNRDEIEMAAIDAGAEDISDDSEGIDVYTAPHNLMKVKAELEKSGIKSSSASLTYVPSTEVIIDDTETARKFLMLIDALEEEDDVNTVYSNAIISPRILATLE